MRSIHDLSVGDYVKVGGKFEKITSFWGICEGVLAKPSQGGFGVITESGREVSMWEAQSYHTAGDVEKMERDDC